MAKKIAMFSLGFFWSLWRTKELHHIAESLDVSYTSYQMHKHSTYLIAASCVVERLQRCLIAVRHICSSAEEHQSTCFIRQRTPEHFYTTALLRDKKNQTNEKQRNGGTKRNGLQKV